MIYYAVYATKRGADLNNEWVIALLSSAKLARRAGRSFVATRPGLVRCRVRRVDLTLQETFAIIRRWARDDVACGKLATAAERLPDPYRNVYLDAYMDAWRETN